MRDIKFRAWDKTKEIMLDVVLMDWQEWWIKVENDQFYYGERHSFGNQDTDRFIVMQYTGLKDKNSIEIYEGDVLRVTSQRDMADGLVYFEEKEAAFCFKIPVESKFEQNHRLLGGWKYLEIIGNIHDNPELIK